MIKVGINENVYIESTVLDDKGSLEIKFQDANAPKVTSAFAAIQDDEVIETNTGLSIRIFSPMPAKEPNELTEEKKVDRALADINKTKGILQHIMEGYMTTDVMPKLGKVAYNGLDITEENFRTQVVRKEIMEAIHKNMCREFIEAMKPFINNPTLQFRLLLLRQSKDKHFATFRSRFLKEQPFFESMAIPAAASKVKFSDYELKEGLNDGTPAARPNNATTDATGDSTPPLTAEAVFGQ